VVLVVNVGVDLFVSGRWRSIHRAG